jgi:hypothetical protein
MKSAQCAHSQFGYKGVELVAVYVLIALMFYFMPEVSR